MTTVAPIQHGGPAPYGPPQTVIDVVEGYRERGFATPFTADVLGRVGVTDALVNRTLATLKLLNLIDDEGHPTEMLDRIKNARGDDDYKAALKDWVRGVYSEVLQFADPAVDSTERVTEAFRGFTPDGQRSRMVTLMLGLFRFAGLIEDVPKRAPAPRPKSRVIFSGGGKASPASKRPGGAVYYGGGKITPSYEMIDPALSPALIGLLQQIPKGPNASWSTDRRGAFLQAFTATLDYVVAVQDPRLPLRNFDDAESPS